MLATNAKGFFPYTPATNLLFGLREALDMLLDEGLDTVFARHRPPRRGDPAAVARLGARDCSARTRGSTATRLTAVLMPDGHDADAFAQVALERFDMSLGNGLGKLAGRVFRIGHLGDFNDLMLAGTLAGVEMSLALSGIPFRKGGVQAALDFLSEAQRSGVSLAKTG